MRPTLALRSLMSQASKKPPATPRPSASILLVSPANHVLLLHRVHTSSSFPSAHVFPGGNLSAFHEGPLPGPGDPALHQDSEAYRAAGIRECFEESGILLARKPGDEALLNVPEDQIEIARKEVHSGMIKFDHVLADWGAKADTANLLPFTRWITPTNAPKRFTTQMYLYFMPLPSSKAETESVRSLPVASEAVIPIPKPDGGIEHTAARFLPPSTWLSQAQSGEIILFPPQFFLLHLVSRYLLPSSSPTQPLSPKVLQQQRDQLTSLVDQGRWGEMCISPSMLAKRRSDGRVVLGLDKPGPELEGSGKRDVDDYVILVDFKKEGPRRVEVGLKKDVLEQERKNTSNL
ncbi:uncharacterized protein K452DRAFT_290857 [Aplosporella prunicola CBS 121167]|uniref:Nudix hydrolase domain-containing protein n=1 Tax=Aplosporella prunicola CBS 121167 TaxID=1176127 RepID=A0A6A6B370_9PEZI|nr:uncharacterized protein K452DRAFT_290857 [Aplosporella prunicola CBS 121167]KAF2138266.1 hypothetical protein K452DRAFT_290857 [Aplosporella prunicola CBS 121167]